MYPIVEEAGPTVMKKQVAAKFVRLILSLVGLVIVQSCSTPQGRGSAKPWSQIGAEEEQQQELRMLPDGWSMTP